MENNKLKITGIDPSQNYEGYLWWSDKTTPIILNNEPIKELPDGNNPFIVEGQLFDKEHDKSWSIRFIDGDYLINCFDLKELKGLDFITKSYLSNRFDGNQKLYFNEFWRPEKDELCEGMVVLQPAELVFVGFNK